MAVVLVERIKGRVADQMVDVPVPSVMEEIMAVVEEEEEKLVTQERVQQRTTEQIVDVSQLLGENVEIESLALHDREQWVIEHMAEVPIHKLRRRLAKRSWTKSFRGSTST